MNEPPPTRQEYLGFQRAYDHFNLGLFGGSLPQVLITLQRRARSLGYFASRRFSHRGDEEGVTDELALNPDGFVGKTDEEILSTLVHEMVHVWQAAAGKPSRAGYHNKEWAARMKAVGLHPSSTGEEGGKETGQRVSHFVVEGGPFHQACRRLLDEGFCLHWQSARTEPDEEEGEKNPKDPSKIRHTCPVCSHNAWAKQGARLLCGACAEGKQGPAGSDSHGPMTFQGKATLMLAQV